MEMSQENCLYSYLKQKFHLKKIGKQEERTGSVWGVGTNKRGKDVGKGCRKVNIYILCTRVCK
jgi:hypothetical protein